MTLCGSNRPSPGRRRLPQTPPDRQGRGRLESPKPHSSPGNSRKERGRPKLPVVWRRRVDCGGTTGFLPNPLEVLGKESEGGGIPGSDPKSQ